MKLIGVAMGLLPLLGASPAAAQGFSACAGAQDPPACVIERASGPLNSAREAAELSGLIAAGMVEAVAAQASGRERETAVLAARLAAGERPDHLTPVQAQRVLALLSDSDFSTTDLPSDARTAWLWPLAMSVPVNGLDLRTDLIRAAAVSDRMDLAARLAAGARPEEARDNDQRAVFASAAARYTDEWRVAAVFMDRGGDRAPNCDVRGVRLSIDVARLRDGYDAGAARRLVAALLEDDLRLPWPDDDVLALKEAGAHEELLALAGGLIEAGRRTDPTPEERSTDFGLAAWALRAAGDRDAALAAAREGLLVVPEAVAGRGRLTSFGTWPVRELFALAPDEAVASGYLLGWDRYEAVLEAGETPDPAWIADEPFGLTLGASLLKRRGDAASARALLASAPAFRPTADSDEILNDVRELLMLAAVGGSRAEVDALFRRALSALGHDDDSLVESLVLLSGYRDAVTYLDARTGDHS